MTQTPTANLRVVRASLKHLDLVAPLFDAYRVFYEQASDPDGARQFVGERLERDESVIFLALDGAGQPLGFTQLYPSFSSVSMKRLWILNDLYVAAGARRMGVAQALMERARQFALETGAKGLELATATDNHAAQALYESLGYVLEDEFYHYFLAVER